ncbi:MAG TPA: hypothetical protein VFJ70_06730 [Burkholderiales bacterium]|nr:hypothetical protein [Burkholderiales bacterium]
MTAKTGDFLDGLFELGLQLAAVLGLCAAAISLWPDDLLSKPRAELMLSDLLWLLGSLALWGLALAWSYFLAEPLRNK